MKKLNEILITMSYRNHRGDILWNEIGFDVVVVYALGSLFHDIYSLTGVWF